MDMCPHCGEDGLDRSLGFCEKCRKSVLKESEIRELQRIMVFEPNPPRDKFKQSLAEMITGGPRVVLNYAFRPSLLVAMIASVIYDYLGYSNSLWVLIGVFAVLFIAISAVLFYIVDRDEFDFSLDLSYVISNYERRLWASHQAAVEGEEEQKRATFECVSCESVINLHNRKCGNCGLEVGYGIDRESLANPLPPKKKFPVVKFMFGSLAAVAVLGLTIGVATKPDNSALGVELKRITINSLQADKINSNDNFGVALIKFGCALDLNSCADAVVQSMVIAEDKDFFFARGVSLRLQQSRITCFGALGSWRCAFAG